MFCTHPKDRLCLEDKNVKESTYFCFVSVRALHDWCKNYFSCEYVVSFTYPKDRLPWQCFSKDLLLHLSMRQLCSIYYIFQVAKTNFHFKWIKVTYFVWKKKAWDALNARAKKMFSEICTVNVFKTRSVSN